MPRTRAKANKVKSLPATFHLRKISEKPTKNMWYKLEDGLESTLCQSRAWEWRIDITREGGGGWGGGFTDQYLGIGRIGEPNINIPAEGLNPEPD